MYIRYVEILTTGASHILCIQFGFNLPDIQLDLSDNVLYDWLFPHY